MKLTLENITIKDHKIYDQEGKYRGEILYEYIRGSHLYGTNVATSDEDRGGIYIMPNESLLGLGFDYQNEIKDAGNDKCIWELGRFLELALSSNPTVLEALFVPDDKVIYEHPVIKELRSHRDEFVTKKCFAPFGGYASQQIKKAQGQNKKIHWDMEKMTRKTVLDFCYTDKGQGSQPIKEFLKENNLDQKYCGLVNIPHQPNTYGLYYDFAAHYKFEVYDSEKELLGREPDDDDFQNWCFDMRYRTATFDKFMDYDYCMKTYNRVVNKEFYGYKGIVEPDDESKSNTVRLSSIPKGELPICKMTYNSNGYASHCKKYREYEEWKNTRNPARYESNLEGERSGNPDLMYDCKNMMHCFRLMAMAKEIAEGKGINLDRTNIDREFLLDVRNRKFGYSELAKRMLKLKDEMDEAIKNSTIKEEIDRNMVNEILLNARKQFNQ